MKKAYSGYFRLQDGRKVRNYYGKRIYETLGQLVSENQLLSFKQIKHIRKDSLFFLMILVANNKKLLLQFVPNMIPAEKRLRRSSSGFSEIVIRSAMPFDDKNFIKGLIVQEINSRTKGALKEDRALKVLLRMKEKKHIRNAYKTKDYKDIRGADIIVQLDFDDDNSNILEILLQVKSSWQEQQVHREKYPDTPSIKIGYKTTDDLIEEKLITIIENYKKGKITHI